MWEDKRHRNSDIYEYDLSTSREFWITTNESYQADPAIYGDIVVFRDERNGNCDIYGYDLSTPTMTPSSTPATTSPPGGSCSGTAYIILLVIAGSIVHFRGFDKYKNLYLDLSYRNGHR